MTADSEDDFVRVIRVWASVAWADGFISEAEAKAMRQVIELADLQGQTRARALATLDEPVSLATEGLGDLAPAVREGIFRAAVRLAHVDLDLAIQELTLLERLRTALSIDEERAVELEAEAEARFPPGDQVNR
jgi:uncharacterized membrane protein YebE (DUF533 family)